MLRGLPQLTIFSSRTHNQYSTQTTVVHKPDLKKGKDEFIEYTVHIHMQSPLLHKLQCIGVALHHVQQYTNTHAHTHHQHRRRHRQRHRRRRHRLPPCCHATVTSGPRSRFGHEKASICFLLFVFKLGFARINVPPGLALPLEGDPLARISVRFPLSWV